MKPIKFDTSHINWDMLETLAADTQRQLMAGMADCLPPDALVAKSLGMLAQGLGRELTAHCAAELFDGTIRTTNSKDDMLKAIQPCAGPITVCYGTVYSVQADSAAEALISANLDALAALVQVQGQISSVYNQDCQSIMLLMPYDTGVDLLAMQVDDAMELLSNMTTNARAIAQLEAASRAGQREQ